MIFLRDSFVCPQSPYRDNDMIFWILHVTLTNLRKFGFEFYHHCHLRLADDRSTGRLLPYNCYTLLMILNKVETAVHGCNPWLSVWFITSLSR